MKVLVLKEPRESESGADPYIKELAACGHSATLVPVLAFQFVSLDRLSDRLFDPERHGGLVFTSPRAVEAVRRCIESSTHREEWNTVKEQWNAKSVYVVGKATASLVEALGLKPLGEHTGTADVLSQLIIEREKSTSLPLFFPCGSLKREVLPTALRRHGETPQYHHECYRSVSLETLPVYETAEHPDLEKNITRYFSEQGVPASVAFFSPSGVKFCLELVKKLAGENLDQIKGHGEPGVYPREHGAQGGVHPGQGAYPSQGTITYTHTHTHSYTTDTLDTPVSLPCMCLDWGRKPEYPEETPAARGEHANSTHTGPRWESTPRPWRCEANALTTLFLFRYHLEMISK
ncbi:uroporphyrinogen-III synthase isoform X2 [Ictalurus punctatus]|uniref:Uroporphyrinogen-III synthase n=1 Tax=Ictalurus punctatus TaxID=7998 RepID=A0A9F7RI09_ICTPU|nr:uroporphyrinogen-III synthase isoform X2 [Ictalurus punctatus]XP_053541051.1 uroporphyrinogen-III synthase isoform X2 [Ictalurus punctatus]XP_053541052.1 uroporphyrinogen-III synthase isoform X2 [Ictalurus punctatus]XP_053541053.1 uroporphyrinogen-III synthase isoform X2 [Ictalurus punctatus]XP_053541054.1 uroporphyrinogen-III synthase isoform X2 [Ictalurus punctatus]XP_053541055.1 uroporphyrinogen-III synthase isoform X2 [Ictalurus punctatus]